MEQDLLLIRRLADGRFHSGADLGAELGVSRAAIWKRIQRLEDLGLEVASVRGKGYRLPRRLSLVDPAGVAEWLPANVELIYTPVTGSTNEDALALAAEHPRTPLVVVTECQRTGRGRRGREWQSPFAANVYVSVLHRIGGGFSSLGGLSLAAGVTVSEVLSSMMPELPVGLKWPNDLLVNGAKLGGVLIELAGEMDGDVQVVVGVGINVDMQGVPTQNIGQAWTDLAKNASGDVPERTRLTGAVAAGLVAMLERFAVEGFAPFMAPFERLDLSRDRPVTVYVGAEPRAGIARGVGEDGALRVDIDGVMQDVHGGEVSLRLR